MGAIKDGAYNENQKNLALIAKAIGHPARVGILQELGKQQNCQCGQLAETIGLAQSTMSQHLKELKYAGIIKGSIDESKACYCLSEDKLQELVTFLQKIIESENLKFATC